MERCHVTRNQTVIPRSLLKEDLAQRAYQRAMRDLDETVLEEEFWGGKFKDGAEQNGGATGEPDDPRWMQEMPY